MGHAIDALSDGVRNIVENPKILLVTYGIAIAMIPVLAVVGVVVVVLSFIPILGPIATRGIAATVVKPLVFGGLLGVVAAGFTGGVGFASYVDTLREKYLSLAGAYLIYELIVFVVGLAIGVILLVTVFLTVGVGSAIGAATENPTAITAGTGVTAFFALAVLLVAVLLVLGIAIVFQFIDAAVVLGDAGAVDSFRESWRLFREAPLSVLGYSVLRVVVGVAILLPAWLVAAFGPQLSDALLWAGLGLFVVLNPIALAISMSYHAAYYGHRLRAA